MPDLEVVVGGRVVCDDSYELFDDEVREDVGALSPSTMDAVAAELRAALGMR